MVKFLGPFFSNPILKEEVVPDFSIFEALEKLFSNIVPGSFVRGAIYMWNQEVRKELSNTPGSPLKITETFLKKTCTCDVQLILDNYVLEFFQKTLKHLSIIGNDNLFVDPRRGINDPEVRRKMCVKKKIATTGYMHDKFFLISEIAGLGKHVIIQMTANINITQCYQFNNMLVMYDDESLFEKYRTHWENLKSNILKRINKEEVKILNNGSLDLNEETSVFFFPRKTCPIEQELKILLDQDDRAKIDITMAYLTRKKFVGLLTQLKLLRKKIRIILSEEEQNVGTVKSLKKAGIKVKIIKNKKYNSKNYIMEGGVKITKDNWQARMHHKFVLIMNEDKKITWTGSYNITYPGVRLNDESVVRLTDPQIYRQYMKIFNRLWKDKKKIPI